MPPITSGSSPSVAASTLSARAACSRAASSAASTAPSEVASWRASSTWSSSSLRPSRSRKRRRAVEGEDHGKRVHAFHEVVAGGLAERRIRAGDVEHVVDDLEAHAEVVTELGERVERRAFDLGDHPADATRGREQRRGLAADRGEVDLLGAVDVEEVLQLEHLTATQLADRLREQRGDGCTERRGELRRAGEQVVAREDRDDVAPARVHARDAATRLRFVDHVVVVQRPEVDELDGHRTGDRVVGRGADPVGGVPGAEGQGGAEPLPSGLHQVGGDLPEKRVLGADRRGQLRLYPLEIGGQRLEPERGKRLHLRRVRRRGNKLQAGSVLLHPHFLHHALPSGGPMTRRWVGARCVA